MQNISELLLNTLRQNTLTALFLLSFLLFKGADAETSQENKFKAFVSNPNGMFLYADCKEKKNRIFLPYQTELSKSEETVSGKNDSETFCKYEFNNKIYYNSCDENPVLEFRKPEGESFTYPHSAKVSIYRIPFQNQEVISEIPEFSMMKIHSVSEEWYEAEFNGKKGCIRKENCIEAAPSDQVKFLLELKEKDLDGDGSPEFLYRIKSRTGLGEEAGRSFGAFKKGKLVPIAFIGDENGSFIRCETKGKRLNCLFETENKKIIKEFIFLNGRLFEKISDGTADKGDGKDFVQIKKELFRKIPIPGKDE